MRMPLVKLAPRSCSWPQRDAGLVLGSTRWDDMELVADGPLRRAHRQHVFGLYADARQAPPVKTGERAQAGTWLCLTLDSAPGHSSLRSHVRTSVERDVRHASAIAARGGRPD